MKIVPTMVKNKYERFGELIKWPQCVITGKKISIEQAKEILARTDSMIVNEHDGNDREFNKKVYDFIGRSQLFGDQIDDNQWRDVLDKIDEFKKKNRLIELEYLDNAQISSCFVYGTHGWCHPNGTIFFNKNVGKWPSWEEINDDCKKIASAFPFLDMKVYLFNQEWSSDLDKGEYYEYPRECVGGFAIKNGRCRMLKQSEYLSPNDEMVIKHRPLFDRYNEEKAAEKVEIFGDKADLDLLHHTDELFFNIEEFKSYFAGYFKQQSSK